MPQLDIGIFFIEFFVNFFFFWIIYLIKAKKIFPFLNKSLKLKKFKIKKINNSINLNLFKFNFLNDYLKNKKNILNFCFLNKMNIYFFNLSLLYFFILKKYNNLFCSLNNKQISFSFLNKQILINKI